MAIWIILILAIGIMILACMPGNLAVYYKLISKYRYWSILIVGIVYILVDFFLILQNTSKIPNFWLIFCLINLTGLIIILKIFSQIKK